MEIPSKYLRTAAILLLAVLVTWFMYTLYEENPWTRDGQVRANIIQITPRASGPIVQVPILDNQLVPAGALLFEIDSRDQQVALTQARAQVDIARNNYAALEQQVESALAQVSVAKASILQEQSQIKEADAEVEKKLSELERQQDLLKQNATSKKALEGATASYDVEREKRKSAAAGLTQARASLQQAEAGLAQARANLGAPGDDNAKLRQAYASLEQAQLNLEYTRVTAPVAGYVTNLKIRPGSYALANQPVLALVDGSSFWVNGFFKETSISGIKPGNRARVKLMSYADTELEGYVESVGWGIGQQDGETGVDLLPSISPSFDWIRLAQRLPVRIHLTNVPPDIELRVGTTASVEVKSGSVHPDFSARPTAHPGSSGGRNP